METIKLYIHHYGYWAVFFGIFFESMGLPLPGETLVIVAGLAAAKGVLNPAWVILLACTATFTANNISYFSGNLGGRRLVLTYGKYIFITEKKFQALESFVRRHGSKIVLVARFIVGLRQLNGFIAGTVKMPWPQFAGFNLLGAILWVGWWAGSAYYLGKKFDNAFLEYYFAVGFVLSGVLIFLVYRFFKKDLALENPPPEETPVSVLIED